MPLPRKITGLTGVPGKQGYKPGGPSGLLCLQYVAAKHIFNKVVLPEHGWPGLSETLCFSFNPGEKNSFYFIRVVHGGQWGDVIPTFQRRDISALLLLMPHTMPWRRENGDCLSILTQAMQGKNRACPSAKNYNREVKSLSSTVFSSSQSVSVSQTQTVLYTIFAFQFLTTFWTCNSCWITIKQN